MRECKIIIRTDNIDVEVASRKFPVSAKDSVNKSSHAVIADEKGIEESKIETPEQMRRFLEKHERLKFLPKDRTIFIPEIDNKQLALIFGDNQAVVDAFECFNTYLASDSIIDRFGNEHDSPGGRREWRAKLEEGYGKEFGELFRKVYYTNQLRRNAMAGVQMNIQNMAMIIERENNNEVTEVSEKLRNIATELKGKLIGADGIPYQSMNEDEKLQTVRMFEDRTADVLWALVGSGVKVEERSVT